MPSYNLRIRLIVLFFVCLILWQTLRYFPNLLSYKEPKWIPVVGPQESVVPIPVAVYYEALCPDSRSFFTKQLVPAFEQAARLMKISLIPYGKAKTEKSGDSYTFTCQHGPVECKANKVHACVIERVPQADVQLKMTTCMIIDNMEPMEIGESCAKEHGVEWDPVFQCAMGNEGSDLLKHYGDMTHSLKPAATFIPTILLAGSHEGQPAILKNLLKEICLKFESEAAKLPECRDFS